MLVLISVPDSHVHYNIFDVKPVDIGNRTECERLLCSVISPRTESHRTSKCDLPLIFKLVGIIDPAQTLELSQYTERQM